MTIICQRERELVLAGQCARHHFTGYKMRTFWIHSCCGRKKKSNTKKESKSDESKELLFFGGEYGGEYRDEYESEYAGEYVGDMPYVPFEMTP